MWLSFVGYRCHGENTIYVVSNSPFGDIPHSKGNLSSIDLFEGLGVFSEERVQLTDNNAKDRGEDMTSEFAFIGAVVALVIGLLLGYLFARKVRSTESGVLAEKIRSEFATEIATARERFRGMESENQRTKAELATLSGQNNEWRNALDTARDERAQLAERAARVPVQDAQLLELNAKLQESQSEILRLSKSEAEKAGGYVNEQARYMELETTTSAERLKLTADVKQWMEKSSRMQTELDITREERTQHSERAARVPGLEQQLADLNDQLQLAQSEILRLSTSEADKGRELIGITSRNAELTAELGDTSTKYHESQQQLSKVSARCSALESENLRIPQFVTKQASLEDETTRLQNGIAAIREDVGRMQAELQGEKEAHSKVKGEWASLKQDYDQSVALASAQQSQLMELTTKLDAERQQSQEKLSLLIEAKEALSNQFKSLASDILEEKSKRFAEQNQTSLGQLLDPLKLRLQEFQGKVELFYDAEGKQRSALSQQVTQLLDLNKTLSDDAKNLTLALKGSSKSQGNWGELILERVLEASGLRKGEEYDVQESHTRDDGSRAQPDVVIHLPEERHLIVDAKVSLSAYEEFVSAEDDINRAAALRRHLDSIRSHIKGLSERNYQALYGLKSLDFVLMFVPVEPAFMVGVTQDNKLFMDAWAKNVLLVSPSTLLFVVRTVAHLWRQEAQSKNAQEIAKRGAELYDRLSAFVADLEKVGDRLKQAQDSYSDAFAKLTTNKGNVIRQAEMLKELGIKPTKALPAALLEHAGVIGHE